MPLVRPQSSPKSLANLPSIPRAFELLHGGGYRGNGGRREGKDGVATKGEEGTTGKRENLFEYLG